MQRWAFIPISLANPFYTRDVIRYLWTMHLVHYSKALFVPCDTLRYLTYEGKGEQHPERLVAQQVRDLRNLIESVVTKVRETHSLPIYEIRLFSEIDKAQEYNDLLVKLRVIIQSDEVLSREFGKFCKFWAKRIFGRVNSKILDIQSKYVLEETALAIYVTEILNYTDEFYSKGDQMFVNWIYENSPGELASLLGGRRPKRQFIELGATPRWTG